MTISSVFHEVIQVIGILSLGTVALTLYGKVCNAAGQRLVDKAVRDGEVRERERARTLTSATSFKIVSRWQRVALEHVRDHQGRFGRVLNVDIVGDECRLTVLLVDRATYDDARSGRLIQYERGHNVLRKVA